MRAAVLCVLMLGCTKGVREDGANGGPGDAAKPERATLRDPLREEVDLQVLSQDFRTNEVKAEQKYANRRMPCLGSVKKVEKEEGGGWRVRFEYFVDGFTWAEGNVFAVFPSSESDKLAQLEYRSPLKFEGRCDGSERGPLGKIIVLRDCRVIPFKK